MSQAFQEAEILENWSPVATMFEHEHVNNGAERNLTPAGSGSASAPAGEIPSITGDPDQALIKEKLAQLPW